MVANYECVRNLVVSHLGPHTDFRLVPYGPETEFQTQSAVGDRTPPPASGGQPVIMTIALQRPKKGVETLLLALALLKNRGVPFEGRIVGGGAMRDSNVKLSHALGLGDRVSFPGVVDHVDPWLAAADIYVQPSLREESGSLALLEAMRMGLPLICSGVDGLAEDVRDGVDGLLFPAGDPARLAGRLGSLIRDADLRRQFAGAARRRFASRHGADTFSRSLTSLYEGDGAGHGSASREPAQQPALPCM